MSAIADGIGIVVLTLVGSVLQATYFVVRGCIEALFLLVGSPK